MLITSYRPFNTIESNVFNPRYVLLGKAIGDYTNATTKSQIVINVLIPRPSRNVSQEITGILFLSYTVLPNSGGSFLRYDKSDKSMKLCHRFTLRLSGLAFDRNCRMGFNQGT